MLLESYSGQVSSTPQPDLYKLLFLRYYLAWMGSNLNHLVKKETSSSLYTIWYILQGICHLKNHDTFDLRSGELTSAYGQLASQVFQEL